MSLPTVTVTGTFTTPDNEPQKGRVLFQLTAPMVDSNDHVIVSADTVTVTLDRNGGFTCPLVPSDAAGLLPNPVPYRVTERFGSNRSYLLNIPSADNTIDLHSLAPIGTPPTPPSAYVLLGDFDTELAAREAADAAEATARASGDTAARTYADGLAATNAAAISGKVAKSGDTMTGDLAMSGHRVTGLADPASNQDAATKAWTSAQITALVNGAPGILDTLGEIATALQSDESAAAALATTVAGKAPITTTTIDLVDRTNNTTETLPAGFTTNCSTAGVTKTAPALAGTVGTPPLRWAVRNGSTGTITLSYPDTSGVVQSLTMLAGEVLTFRQKNTSGWAAESGNKTLASLSGTYLQLPPTYTLAGRPVATGSLAVIWVSDRNGGQLQQDTATGVWTDLAPGMSQAATPELIALAERNSNSVLPAGTGAGVYADAPGIATTSFTSVLGALYRVSFNGQPFVASGRTGHVAITDAANTVLHSTGIVPASALVVLQRYVAGTGGTVSYKVRLNDAATSVSNGIAILGDPTYVAQLSVEKVQ